MEAISIILAKQWWMFGDRVRRGRKQEESRSIWVDMLTGVGYRLDIGV